MTDKAIERQIEAIRIETAKASVSKETAITFLFEAGILEGPIEKYLSDDSAVTNEGANNKKR